MKKNSSLTEETAFILNNSSMFEELAKHRVLFLHGEIDENIATHLVGQMIFLNKLNSRQEITLYINSPGGTVQDGLFSIYDTMQSISAPVSTFCIGEAGSAAAVILAAGHPKKRFAYPHARVMIHTIQASDISGSQFEIDQENRQIKKLNRVLMEMLAQHSGQTLTKILRDCRNDKWMSAPEAMKYGIIDFIPLPNKNLPKLKNKQNNLLQKKKQ